MWQLVSSRYLGYLNYINNPELTRVYSICTEFLTYIQTKYSTIFLFRRPLDYYVIMEEFNTYYVNLDYTTKTKCLDFINLYIMLCPFNFIGRSYIMYGGKLLVNDPTLNGVILDSEKYTACIKSIGFLNTIYYDIPMEEFNTLFYDIFLSNYIDVDSLLMTNLEYKGYPSELEPQFPWEEHNILRSKFDQTHKDRYKETIRKIYQFLKVLDTALYEETKQLQYIEYPNSLLTLDDYEPYISASGEYVFNDFITSQAYSLSSYINILPEHKSIATNIIANYIVQVSASMFPDIPCIPDEDDPGLKKDELNIPVIYSLENILYDTRTFYNHTSSYSYQLGPNIINDLINHLSGYAVSNSLLVEDLTWDDFIDMVNNVITYNFIMVLANTLSKSVVYTGEDHVRTKFISYVHHILLKEAFTSGKIKC